MKSTLKERMSDSKSKIQTRPKKKPLNIIVDRIMKSLEKKRKQTKSDGQE